MDTSRERMLQQIERCVLHQLDSIVPGPTIIAESELYAGMGEFVHQVDDLPREIVDCDTSSVWGLRPPGEEMPAPWLYYEG